MPGKPKTWDKSDMPTPEDMKTYLSRIRAVRSAFSAVSGFPEVPENMSHLTVEKANDIERVLLRVHETIERLEKSRVYSGELQAGGF